MSRRSFSRSAVVVLLLACCAAPFAAGGADAPKLPFEPAEELYYEGEFTRFVLRGVKVADFKFTSSRAAAADARTPAPLRLTGDVASRGFFAKLFKFNFRYRVESTVEPRTFSVLSTKTLDEQGRRVRAGEAVYDQKEHTVTWTERDPNDPAREPRVVNSSFDGAAHDIVTAVYFLRTQPLEPGRAFDLTVSDSGRVYTVPVKVFAERKPLRTVVGRVAVVRVEVGIFGAGRLIEEEGQMDIWFTSDARRLPVRAKVSHGIGTVDITLKRVSTARS